MSGRKNEIVELIGPEAGGFFARHYDVSDEGNFEGHNILNRLEQRRRAAKPTRRGWPRCAPFCSTRAPPASGPASTTRCWPTGTG